MKSTTKLTIGIIGIFVGLLLSFQILASPNHLNPPIIGFEEVNNTWHIWNSKDDYYFNSTSGIQFTNHYNQYWSHNYFCGGVKLNKWVYYCTESLPFNWTKQTDNQTFVNISGEKDITFTFAGRQYSLKLGLTYHLKTNDTSLTVQPSIKNTGSNDIPVDLGFAWKLRDIQISNTQQSDLLELDADEYLLNESLDLLVNNLTHEEFSIYDSITNEFLWLDWNDSLDYNLTAKSQQGQYNAPVTLVINIGNLPVNQEKSTRMYWFDALCSITTCSLDSPTTNLSINVGDTFTMSTRVVSDCPETKLRELTQKYANRTAQNFVNITSSSELQASFNPQSAYEDFTNEITVKGNIAGNYSIRGLCRVEGAGTKATAVRQVNVTIPASCTINNTNSNVKLTQNSTQCFNITADNTIFDCGGNWLVGRQYDNQYAIMADSRKNITVKSCFFSNHSRGVSFINVNSSLVTNNSFPGIKWIKSNGTITLDAAGIYFSGGFGNRIIGNRISDVNATQLITGLNNNCGSIRAFGIGIVNAKNSTIINNTISSVVGSDKDRDDALSCTYIIKKEGYGVFLQSSDLNTVHNLTANMSNLYDFYVNNGNVTMNDSRIGNKIAIISPTDAVFINSTFNRSGLVFSGADSNLTIQWYIRANVTAENGTPLVATVNITDVGGGQVFYENSGSDGLTNIKAVTETVISNGVGFSRNLHLVITNKTGYGTDSRLVNITNTTIMQITLMLTITNEAEARQAIQQGINNTIPNASVFTDKQIYVINENNTHSRGRFDKVALLNNQTWGFNYLTGNESFTNVSGISRGNIVNIWERISLAYSQIVSQVEAFINSTKI